MAVAEQPTMSERLWLLLPDDLELPHAAQATLRLIRRRVNRAAARGSEALLGGDRAAGLELVGDGGGGVNCLFTGCADARSGPSAQPHICRPEQLHWPPLAPVAMQDRVPVASAPARARRSHRADTSRFNPGWPYQQLTWPSKVDSLLIACHALRINPKRAMAKTKHYGARVSQRGIREATVELAQQHGIPHGDKLVLGRKQIRSVLDALDRERKELIRAMDKGGVIVVEGGGTLVTAYDFDSFNRY